MRARRAAAIEADPDKPLRDADELLAPAIEETLASLDLKGEDAAVAQLCRQYARAIDRARDPAWAMRWLGPLLLANLEALQATPVERSKVKPEPEPRPRSWLDEMRAARTTGPGRVS